MLGGGGGSGSSANDRSSSQQISKNLDDGSQVPQNDLDDEIPF